MVKRKSAAEPLPKIEAIVEDVERGKGEPFEDGESKDQYHILLKPTSKDAVEFVKDSKTKRFHVYLNISDTTEEDNVAEGSKIDLYLQEIESVLPETKKMSKHEEVFKYLIGKKFIFTLKKIGRAFRGHEPREIYVPHELVE